MQRNVTLKSCDRSILVSTRLPQLPKEKNCLLFLGGWCQLEPQKVSGNAYVDVNICAPFGFSEKEMRLGENAFEEIYEDVLKAVVNGLNKYHSKDYDLRYWEIFCGSWTYRFAGLLLNRYFQLKKAADEHPNLKFHYCVDDDDFTLASSCEIESVKCSSDNSWNSVLNRILIQRYFTDIENLPCKYQWPTRAAKKRSGLKYFIKKILPLFSFGGKREELFVYKSYLSATSDLALKRSLNAKRNLWQTYRAKTHSLVDKAGRTALFNQNGQKELTSMVLTMMSYCLPRIFLEDYDTNVKFTAKLNWPRAPRVIYTANGFAGDPIFQLFVAEKVRRFGTTYIVGQHGANYGTLRMSRFWPEMRVASKFISWGWSKNSNYDVDVIAGHNFIDRKINSCAKKNVLIVLKGPGNRSAISCRHFEYMLEVNRAVAIAQLFKHFPDWRVTVRLHHNATEFEAKFIRRECKKNKQSIQLDDGKNSFQKASKDYGLFIFTYDSAGFLECLGSDQPTIGAFKYSDDRYFETAKQKYDKLKMAGVINGDISALSNFLDLHQNNITDWWRDQSVQSVVKEFTSEYARQKPNDQKFADLLVSIL